MSVCGRASGDIARICRVDLDNENRIDLRVGRVERLARGQGAYHRTLPPNFPGDIQGIQQIYHEYITNIPGREYTPNIPQSIQAEDDSSTSMVT